MHPLLILLLGIAIVLGMIIVLRVNAFIALITASIVVSLLSPGETAIKISRVADAFGATAGKIGIVIALAAVIGGCMMESGAADRIVRAFLALLGEKRTSVALMGSGYVLAIPVFFDTVFYLLVPLARSLYLRTRQNYLLYLMAIAAGGAITHTLVPPTPGPLVMADLLGVDIGTMILVGGLVAIPAAVCGLIFSNFVNRINPIEMRSLDGKTEPTPMEAHELPPLLFSLLPVVLPVLMISTDTVVDRLHKIDPQTWSFWKEWTAVVGNPNLALLASAAVAVLLYVRQRRPTRQQVSDLVEQSLMSAGVIILITAGGGAFGAMLKDAQIGPAIQELFQSKEASGGPMYLVLAFLVGALLKIAQGSGTVAMITTAGMLAAMLTDSQDRYDPSLLGFHPVYLALAVGSGSLVGSWMNDSGFWIFAKMGGLTEVETLKSWTLLLIVLGCSAFVVTVVLSQLLPLSPPT